MHHYHAQKGSIVPLRFEAMMSMREERGRSGRTALAYRVVSLPSSNRTTSLRQPARKRHFRAFILSRSMKNLRRGGGRGWKVPRDLTHDTMGTLDVGRTSTHLIELVYF